MRQIKMYTDGACLNNPGAGGYAAILQYNGHEKVIVGNLKVTTNNRMELMAVIEGLKALKEKCEVTIYSDSQYVVKTIQNNWKRKINLDLWFELDKLMNQHQTKFVWVKGHAGHPENERCDKLASEQAAFIKFKNI